MRTEAREPADRGGTRCATPRRRLLIGGASLLMITLAGCTTTGPEPTPTRNAPTTAAATAEPVAPTDALTDAMYARLPAAARTAPTFTWDSTGRAGEGTSISGDRRIVLAAACDSGGRLVISVGQDDTLLDCTEASAAGPFDVSAAMPTDPPGAGVQFSVRVASGHPRYVGKAVGLKRAER